jgi:hypothetical protein
VSDPKEIKSFNAGHTFNEEARRDRAEWLICILCVKRLPLPIKFLRLRADSSAA